MHFFMGICRKRFICINLRVFFYSTNPSYVCRLVKSLYGVKQAPRAWHSKFTEVLPLLGFVASQSDTSLFVKHYEYVVVIMVLYVDDIILTVSSDFLVQEVINGLAEFLDLKC